MNKLLLIAVVVLAVLFYLYGFPQANIVRSVTSASQVCSPGIETVTCSFNQFTSLNGPYQGCYGEPPACPGDPLNSVQISGVKIDGLPQWLLDKGRSYDACKFTCSGSGPKTFNTGWIEGSYGTGGDTCTGHYLEYVGYHEGNAFNVNCIVEFYNKVIEPEPTPKPTKPEPPVRLWDVILQTILSWLSEIIKWLTPGTITGGGNYQPGESATFIIDMNSPIDTDCIDGFCQYQYGSYAVIDKAGTIVQESIWKETTGSYVETVTLNVPSQTGNYAFVSVLYNYDMRFTNQWIIEKEYIASKEAVEFTVGYSAPTIQPQPPTDLFSQIINSIVNFLQGIFSWFQ